MTFSAEIYEQLRDQKGLTNYKVGQLAGVNEYTLWSWTHGRSEPKIVAIERIAKVLDIEPEFLRSDR